MDSQNVFTAVLLAGLMAAAAVSPAQAATVTYSDRTTWQNAVNALTPIVTEDFNSQPLGSLTDNAANTVGLITVFPHNAPGSAIQDGAQPRQIDGTQFLHIFVDGDPVRTMDVLFGTDVVSFGFDFTQTVGGGDNVELTLGNGDNFILSAIVEADAGFVGFISDTAFDSITFHDPFISWSDVGIDNFSFADTTQAVPAVSQWGLAALMLLLAACGTIVIRRRQAAVA